MANGGTGMEWRQFLSRFRPAAVPGPAGAGKMPVDRPAEAAAELAPVFALLADTEADAARIVTDAAARAARTRADAERAATATAAEARARAPQMQAEAARDAAPPDGAPGDTDDGDRVQRDRRRAEQLPLLTERALGDVHDLLGLSGAPPLPSGPSVPR